MKITHYGIRDNHLHWPEDYPEPEWDVIARTECGKFFYSEQTFYTEVDAEHWIRAHLVGLFEFSFAYWAENEVNEQLALVDSWQAVATSGEPA